MAAMLDLGGLVLAWETAMHLRVWLNPIMRVQMTMAEVERLTPPFEWLVLIWVSAWLLVHQQSQSADSIGSHLLRLLRIWLFSSIVVLAATLAWWHGGRELSRSFVILYLSCSLFTIVGGRYLALLATRRMERRYMAPELIGLIGDGPEALALIQELAGRGGAGVQVVGVVRSRSDMTETSRCPVPVLGTTTELASVINRARITRLIITNGHLDERELESCNVVARRMGVTVGQRILQRNEPSRVQFASLCGLRILEYKPVPFTRTQEIVKRMFDVIVATGILILASPLFAIIAALVKLTSAGPVLFRSSRVGKGGRHFTFLKFRSMEAGPNRADEERIKIRDGHLFKLKNDPRVTPIGKILRRYSLDELPQLVNVLLGEMSLVGPRPLPAEDLDPDGQSSEFRSWSDERSRVLPGIAGLWQVRGRSDTGFERMMKLDSEYIRNWSLALDFKILLETPLAVISSKGAY